IDQGIVVDGELVFSELDTIAGLEVDSIDAFSSIDLNNRGDFVFTARLRDDDGNRFGAVVVATLIPEPTSLALLGLSGLLVARRRVGG
ncbi:MAG: PEP-CTERM sorting domain-containing protein, partial [Planctomycetota bacterium]